MRIAKESEAEREKMEKETRPTLGALSLARRKRGRGEREIKAGRGGTINAMQKERRAAAAGYAVGVNGGVGWRLAGSAVVQAARPVAALAAPSKTRNEGTPLRRKCARWWCLLRKCCCMDAAVAGSEHAYASRAGKERTR